METPQPLSADQLRALSQEVKQALTTLYGERLEQVILYGSYARGDYHADSDVDYMVVLNDEEVNSYQEISYMIDTVYNLSDEYRTLVSVKPISSKKYQRSDLFLYQNARREGRPV